MEKNIIRIYSLAHQSILIVGLLIIEIILSSCQKVISIDLNNAAPQIVIEGNIIDSTGPYKVTISKTGDYFEPSLFFPPVSHAQVTIRDDGGQIDTLQEVLEGTYFSRTLQGIPGRSYSLKIMAEGQEYDAISLMPQKIRIDSIATKPRTEFDGDKGYDIYVLFKDPPTPGNYYRLKLHVNSLPSDSITGQRYFLYSDKLTNGNEETVRVRIGQSAHPGDTLTVELLSIDAATYDYFNTLKNILASDRSPTSLSPANPNTNLSNGSLGYFAAYTVDKRVLILP